MLRVVQEQRQREARVQLTEYSKYGGGGSGSAPGGTRMEANGPGSGGLDLAGNPSSPGSGGGGAGWLSNGTEWNGSVRSSCRW